MQVNVQESLALMGLSFDIPDEVKNIEVEPEPIKDYNAWIVEAINNRKGNLPGFWCDKCKNKGYILYIKDGYEINKECECMKKRKMIDRAKRSGIWESLSEMKFDNYICNAEWQKHVKTIAMNYAKKKSGWFFIGGQTGSGKTHICTAISGALIKAGKELKYVLWRDLLHNIQGVQFDYDSYSKKMQKLRDVDVLYIDDFLKSQKNTESELNIAFEIINDRYISHKLTIISSEKTLSEIYNLDAAVAGRITQMCGDNVITIAADAKKNMRIKA